MPRRDAAGVSCVLAVFGAPLFHHHLGVEPRPLGRGHWGALCAGSDAPAACLPRAGLL